MNKKNIVILGSMLLLLVSCGSRGNLDHQETPKYTPQETVISQEDKTDTLGTEETEIKNYIEVKNITQDPSIQFDSFTVQQFEDLQEELTGTVSGKVEKITVLYANSEKDNTDETPYTLKKFQPGDTTFLFNAFKKYATLDYGINTYTVTAFEGNIEHTIEMKVFVQKPESVSKKQQESQTGTVVIDTGITQAAIGDVDLTMLPTNGAYGNPVKLGNGGVTYSDIKGLEIKNVGKIDVSMDPRSITDYIKENYNGWFFWNTVTPISGKKGVSFYVILSPTGTGEYVYQKHYYDGESLYGILPLDSGILDEGQELKVKNTELSSENSNFGIVTPTNKLFTDILK